VDKKLLLGPNLATIMTNYIAEINTLIELLPFRPSTLKSDGSPVTELDLSLSELCERMAKKHFPDVNFYCEEKFSAWKFPLMAIDPLDGTREYIAGRAEWAISLGLFESKAFVGQGWVYNPVTKELFDEQKNQEKKSSNTIFRGEVSRTEWDNDLFKNFESDKIQLKPVGSIAYKLGRLSAGKSDFVISLNPKNIWDIAGGTILCQKSNIKFYSEGKLVTEVREKYHPPLIWCREEIFSMLSSFL